HALDPPLAVAYGDDVLAHPDGMAIPGEQLAYSFPHLPGAVSRIAEAVDQGDDDGLAIVAEPFRKQCMLDCAYQAQTLDPLRSPIGGELTRVHPPYFLGVSLEEDAKQSTPELIGDPVLERLRVLYRAHTRPGIACQAARRLE